MSQEKRLQQILEQIEELRSNIFLRTWYVGFLIDIIHDRGGPLREDQMLAF